MYILQRFPPHLQYVATLPCEIQNPKMLPNFHVDCDNMFNKIYCKILCNLPQKYCTIDFT